MVFLQLFEQSGELSHESPLIYSLIASSIISGISESRLLYSAVLLSLSLTDSKLLVGTVETLAGTQQNANRLFLYLHQ